jgi:predicted O-methyltransferase YrrM
MIYDYIKYLLKAKDEYSLHSPFLFEFYIKIVNDKGILESFQEIENLREQLLQDERIISITDFGAGSKLNLSNNRKIKDIAKNSQKSPKLGQFLYRIIAFYEYKNVLDLGTSLGLTTTYLASQKFDNQVISFEGCPKTAKIAQENFDKLSLKNIEIIVGNIDETLPEKLKEISSLDFVFFDANHRYEPTIRYFEQCLSKAHEGSCFVFDDLYWSKEMKKAWQFIKNHPSVTVSLDFFWLGIVFFHQKQEKQDFVLKL